MASRMISRTFARTLLISSSSSSRSFASSSYSLSTATTQTSIPSLVDQIASLTLLQAADLVSALKEKLNIVELASAPSSAAAPAAAAAVVEEVVVVKEKTVFNVTLTKIDATAKAKAIREVKAIIPGMNLVEAKKFVESLPKVLKEGATKEEAEKLKKALEAVGAEVLLD